MLFSIILIPIHPNLMLGIGSKLRRFRQNRTGLIPYLLQANVGISAKRTKIIYSSFLIKKLIYFKWKQMHHKQFSIYIFRKLLFIKHIFFYVLFKIFYIAFNLHNMYY